MSLKSSGVSVSTPSIRHYDPERREARYDSRRRKAHYDSRRKEAQKYTTGETKIGISASQLKATFDDYNDIASNKKKDPFGKKFFYNFLITINDQFHVALMSPVLHYTIGGIDINAESEVRDMQEQVIPGLFEKFQTLILELFGFLGGLIPTIHLVSSAVFLFPV
ncbi:hypothetical protein C2G38_2227949 [Gigaspora rosea]|uniref:FAD-dependent oxidoreductase 2 FAD-binding domain-containing protein n=1 Tax=Gigaspora rosea TaxID=44941 RepID=A0A397U4Q0_9GLOM|nr:hypothetical protein C2G38_2227949 [Gigaspora rosea]